MKYICGIYIINNLINNHFYIGKSENLNRRKYIHFYELNKNFHKNRHLQNAYNLYGKENFIFKILIICEKEELIYYEQSLVDILNPEYNIRKICVDTNLGLKHSEKTRLKMRENHINVSGSCNPMYGKTQTDESKLKNRNSQLGENGHNFNKTLPESTLKKMSEARIGDKCYMFGKQHTEETKKKISESNKNNNKNIQKDETNKIKRKPMSDETKEKISNSHKGKKSKNITSKEIILKVKEMLNNGISVFKICEETKISKYTVSKIRKGFYDEYYDL
jgi:group I intron endonuclease